MTEIDLDFLRSYRARSRRVATTIATGLGGLILRAGPSTRIRLEGWRDFDRPVIFATNHTHLFDFLPLWLELLRRNHQLVGWVKARMYKKWGLRWLLKLIGNNFPLVSRGYLIAADFRSVCGRAPTADEYRWLRDHVDEGQSLEKRAPFDRIVETPRTMLGRRFRPAQEDYRTAIRQLFYEMMQVTLDETGRCIADGYHLHIYPEGQISRRLSEGHTGIIHAAVAFSMPIVPVGIHGADEVFVGNSPWTRGGELRLRFGEPVFVERNGVGEDFRPFHPDDQQTYESQLQHSVDTVMLQLDELLDEPYRCCASSRRRLQKSVERFY